MLIIGLVCQIFSPSQVGATPTISLISDNRGDYPISQIPKYEKLEITFQIQTQAENLQFPYLAASDAGSYLQQFVDQGITVDAIFTDPSGQEFRQPAFYYQAFDESLGGTNTWQYPTGDSSWKVRFSPNRPGSWKYRLQAKDKSGIQTTNDVPFIVTNSDNKGFIRVSKTDSRYFEYEDGTYFPALGYQGSGLNEKSSLQIMQDNRIQFVRYWLMSDGIYGSQWTHFRTFPLHYDGYLPRVPTIPADPQNTGSKKFYYIVSEGSSWFERCMFAGFERGKAPLKPNTNYYIRIPYTAVGVAGPRVAGADYGVTVKIGGWLDNCGNPNVGNSLVPLQQQNGQAEIKLIWNSGTATYLDNFYVVLENAAAGSIYIDQIDFYEMTGGTLANPQLKEFNILDKPDPNEHLYIAQRSSYKIDKFIEEMAQRDIYLKAVVLEKEERTFKWLDAFGDLVSESKDNFYGAGKRCTHCRDLTTSRWLQEAWFRYLQARWGYSTHIHSWELINEGDPDHYGHFALADEMGKTFKCRVFGVEVPYTDGVKCEYDHPNAHMTTTSFWHSFPGNSFWKSPKYPNTDFADVHAYISTSYAPCEEKLKMETDAAYYHIWHSQNLIDASIGKPVIRGEAGMDGHEIDATRSCGVRFIQSSSNLGLDQDKTGVWFHNYLWAQLHSGGMMETYWWVDQHIYDPKNGTFDFRPMFKPLNDFIHDVPLNNGKYQDIQASSTNSNLRVVGQKDTVNQRAHLWVQNIHHTWKKVVDNTAIPAQSGTVSVSGFAANQTYMLQEWDTYTGAIKSTTNVTSTSTGTVTININNLTTDTAYKVINSAAFAQIFLPMLIKGLNNAS